MKEKISVLKKKKKGLKGGRGQEQVTMHIEFHRLVCVLELSSNHSRLEGVARHWNKGQVGQTTAITKQPFAEFVSLHTTFARPDCLTPLSSFSIFAHNVTKFIKPSPGSTVVLLMGQFQFVRLKELNPSEKQQIRTSTKKNK